MIIMQVVVKIDDMLLSLCKYYKSHLTSMSLWLTMKKITTGVVHHHHPIKT